VLVTNGCSFVWGDELDGYDDSPPTHWEHTFTHKLAEKLGCEYTNIATCGASNHKIFRDTVDYLINKPKPEYLVILWSAWQRDEHFEAMSKEREDSLKIQRWNNATQISPERVANINNHDRDIVGKYMRDIKNLRHHITSSITYMLSIQQLCDSMGIKLIQGVFHERMKHNLMSLMHEKHRDDNWSDWMDYESRRLDMLREECKIGLNKYTDFYSYAKVYHNIKPYYHPDEESHTGYANILHDIILEYHS
jgi:hypothetical protein